METLLIRGKCWVLQVRNLNLRHQRIMGWMSPGNRRWSRHDYDHFSSCKKLFIAADTVEEFFVIFKELFHDNAN